MRGTARPIFQSEIRSAGVRRLFADKKKLRRSRDATPQLYLITFKKPFLFQREARYLLAVQVNLAP